MLRLILFIILILILYYILHFLIRDMPPLRKRMDRKSEPEELVEDPYCKTYIPKRSALKKRIAGKEYYFCDQECFKRYLQKESS